MTRLLVTIAQEKGKPANQFEAISGGFGVARMVRYRQQTLPVGLQLQLILVPAIVVIGPLDPILRSVAPRCFFTQKLCLYYALTRSGLHCAGELMHAAHFDVVTVHPGELFDDRLGGEWLIQGLVALSQCVFRPVTQLLLPVDLSLRDNRPPPLIKILNES